MELHSNISPTTFKLIPVKTGFVSSVEAAKAVWLTKSLKMYEFIDTFFLDSSKSILGYSDSFIPIKLN